MNVYPYIYNIPGSRLKYLQYQIHKEFQTGKKNQHLKHSQHPFLEIVLVSGILHICIYVCTLCVCSCLWKPQDRIEFPRTSATNSCELLGTQTQASAKSSKCSEPALQPSPLFPALKQAVYWSSANVTFTNHTSYPEEDGCSSTGVLLQHRGGEAGMPWIKAKLGFNTTPVTVRAI